MILPISQPGTAVGSFSKEIELEIGFSFEVILSASHDTGSAVMAVPNTAEPALYISSGTWSLIGTETTDNFRNLAKEFHVTLPEKFLYEKDR